jgi:hypothetical protein
MVHVAFYMAGGLEADAQPAHRTHYASMENGIFRRDVAGHTGVLANYDANPSYISLYLTINPQFAFRDEVASDCEAGSNNGHRSIIVCRGA